MKSKYHILLIKERQLWRLLGIRKKDSRRLARSLVVPVLYCLGVFTWLALHHWYAFRQVFSAMSAIGFFMAITANAISVFERKRDEQANAALEDVPPLVVTEDEMKQSERLWELHIDNKPIEVVPDEEIEKARQSIQEKIRKAQSGDIELEVKRNATK